MRLRGIGKPEGCKLIRVDAELEAVAEAAPDAAPSGGGHDGDRSGAAAFVIRRIMIRGDFFAVPEEGFEMLEAALAGTRAADLGTRFDALAASGGLQLAGISGAGVAEVFGRAFDVARVQTA